MALNFLETSGVAEYERRPLAGDASNRRYERLTDSSGASVILMDAPTAAGESVAPFVRIAKHLTQIGLSAPDIRAEDTQNGFLLLEDLGDALFARLIEREPGRESDLYRAATDVLLTLRDAPTPRLERYSPAHLAEMTGLAFTDYAAPISGTDTQDAPTGFFQSLTGILGTFDTVPYVLALRDYHAENLLWLPDRRGPTRVGVLDFQDAFLGHPAYDLVSLLQDARRDVSPSVEQDMIAYYIDQSGHDAARFTAAYAALGTQRNLRILGVFARLSRRFGKPQYVDLIPRVWAHLMRDLEHPVMAPVAEALKAALPAPTPDHLSRLQVT